MNSRNFKPDYRIAQDYYSSGLNSGGRSRGKMIGAGIVGAVLATAIGGTTLYHLGFDKNYEKKEETVIERSNVTFSGVVDLGTSATSEEPTSATPTTTEPTTTESTCLSRISDLELTLKKLDDDNKESFTVPKLIPKECEDDETVRETYNIKNNTNQDLYYTGTLLDRVNYHMAIFYNTSHREKSERYTITIDNKNPRRNLNIDSLERRIQPLRINENVSSLTIQREVPARTAAAQPAARAPAAPPARTHTIRQDPPNSIEIVGNNECFNPVKDNYETSRETFNENQAAYLRNLANNSPYITLTSSSGVNNDSISITKNEEALVPRNFRNLKETLQYIENNDIDIYRICFRESQIPPRIYLIEASSLNSINEGKQQMQIRTYADLYRFIKSEAFRNEILPNNYRLEYILNDGNREILFKGTLNPDRTWTDVEKIKTATQRVGTIHENIINLYPNPTSSINTPRFGYPNN